MPPWFMREYASLWPWPDGNPRGPVRRTCLRFSHWREDQAEWEPMLRRTRIPLRKSRGIRGRAPNVGVLLLRNRMKQKT